VLCAIQEPCENLGLVTPLLSIALVHQPVLDRNGEVITSTVDHFDVMDGSRLSLTYPVWRFYVVNRVPAQRALVERLIGHGSSAAGRDQARGSFDKTHWAPDLETVLAEHEDELGRCPTTVATSATPTAEAIGFATLRQRVWAGEPTLLLVGKAWGLAPEMLEAAALRLEPISGGTGFNHLSVRSAMAILVDRLLGSP